MAGIAIACFDHGLMLFLESYKDDVYFIEQSYKYIYIYVYKYISVYVYIKIFIQIYRYIYRENFYDG